MTQLAKRSRYKPTNQSKVRAEQRAAPEIGMSKPLVLQEMPSALPTLEWWRMPLKTLDFSMQLEYSTIRRFPIPAAVKENAKNTTPSPKMRKSKSQADLAPSEDCIVRAL
jgi:hypothetical protein